MLELVPLYRLEMTPGRPRLLRGGPLGTRSIVMMSEGQMVGDRIRGKVLQLTGDWMTVSPDGRVATLDVRGLLETDDGAVIYTHCMGRTDMSRGPGMAPLYAAPLFETGDLRYAWLNRIVSVAKGGYNMVANKIELDVFEVR